MGPCKHKKARIAQGDALLHWGVGARLGLVAPVIVVLWLLIWWAL